MSTQILHAALDPASIKPDSQCARQTKEALLACDIEELAVLRFSIILTARWQASESEDPERRVELREELKVLRKRYEDKIDAIAMTFGVAAGMNAKGEVERTVIVPRDAKVAPTPNYQEERAGSGFDNSDSEFEV